MPDNNERQWFENSNVPQDQRRNGKKGPSKKGPANPTRKTQKAKVVQASNGNNKKRPPRPNNTPSRNNPNLKVNSNPKTPFPMKEEAIKEQKRKEYEAKKKAELKKKNAQKVAEAKVQEAQKKAEAIKKSKTNPDDIRKKGARRSSLFNSGLATILVLLGILVVMVVVHHLYDYFAVKPNLEFITNGSIEHTIGSRAIFVRDENVVLSSHAGDVVTEAAEGSRVAAGQSLAMVVPDDMQSVVANLRNTQSQISDVQQELIAQGLADGAQDIYSDINQSLSPIVNMLRLDSSEGNLSEISSYASSISVLLNQRELQLSELDFDDERLRVLRSDERGYESTLQNRATIINASEPGIVSFKIDGLENTLSFEMLLNSDAGTIRDYINDSLGVIPSNLSVEAGQPVARISKNDEQYIACFLNESEAPSSAFAVGTVHTIIVGSEGISIGKCIVERIQLTDNGNYLVVFSTTRYVEDLLDVRTADIEVVITETSGMRVPVSSLVNPDYNRGVATIYVNDQGFCAEVGVLVIDYDREFAIITPMGDSRTPNLQTVFITNPSSVRPGEQVS